MATIYGTPVILLKKPDTAADNGKVWGVVEGKLAWATKA